MTNAGGVRVSSGTWLESMVNPPFPNNCGLNAGLVMDLSGSVEDSKAAGTLKGAASALVDALAGTPSSIALFTFGSRAPARQANNINRPMTPVSTTSGANTVKDWINGISVPEPHEATNWDRGLMQVAQSPEQFDVVVVITDGNPTRYGVEGLGTGILTRFVEIENSVFSANAVKAAKHARIIAIGVGDGATKVPGDNFAAISGPVTGNANPLLNDYYQTDWDQAAAVLKSVAVAGCQGSMTVVKQIVPTANVGGDVTGALPADGWQFAVAGTSATPAKTTLQTQVGTGAASAGFTLDNVLTPGRLKVTETAAQDYNYYPVEVEGKSQNADCFKLGGANPARIEVKDEGAASFSVEAGQKDVISCTVYNQHKAANPASVKVSKKWTLRQVDQDGKPVPGTAAQTFDEGQQPGQFQASLKVTLDKGAATEREMTDLTWGTEYSGMTEAVQASLTEDKGPQVPFGCTVAGADVTGEPDGSGGLSAIQPQSLDAYSYKLGSGLNLFQITNTIECRALLSLYKVVENRSPVAAPDLWTLSAIPLPDPSKPGVTPLPGPTGQWDGKYLDKAPIGDVTPGWTYALAESAGDPEYVQWRVPDPAEPFPEQASGSWACNLETKDGILTDPNAWISEGLRGAVSIPWGGHVYCFAVNYTGQITVIKNVNGGSAKPTDWTFTVTPQGLGADSLPTHSALASGLTTRIKPGQTYKITEDSPGPANHVLDSVDCTWDELNGSERTQRFTEPPELTVDLGGSATCTFNNRALAHVSVAKSNSLGSGKVPSSGSQFDYYLDVTSDGAAAAQGVDLHDAVPAGLRIVSVTPSGSGWTDLTSGNALHLTNASLPAGAYRIAVTVAVTRSLDTTKNLVNEACVEASNAAPDRGNCSTTTIPGGSPPPSSPPPSSPPPSSPPASSPPVSSPPASSGPPVSPTTTGSPSSSPPSPDQGVGSHGPGQPGGKGPGGGLPFTGTDSAGWLTGLAAALMVLGLALVAARRRSRVAKLER
jgi:hypothetical protein